MSALIALAATLLSVALLALFLWRLGAKIRLGLDAAAAGVALCATVSVFHALFDPRLSQHVGALTEAFAVAGWPEEALKMLGFAAFLRGHGRAQGLRDVTLAAGALALGFAALENFFHIANAEAHWATTAWRRAATAAPAHVMLGLAGGYVVARAPANARGVALGVLAWAGLGLLHGLYDFAALGSLPGAARPAAFDAFAAALGLEARTALWGVALVAAAAMALTAAAALNALGPAPGRRRLGFALAAILVGGAALGVVAGTVRAYAFADGEPLVSAAALALLPFTSGLLSMPPRRALSHRARFGLAGSAAAVTIIAAATALIWGSTGWRRIKDMRAQAQGAQYYAAHDFARAIGAYSHAIELAPNSVEPLAKRAAIYAETRRFPDALADLDRALRLAPTAALHGERGEVNIERNQPAAALADLDAAVRLDDAHALWLAVRARARIATHDPDGALADLTEAARRAPKAPEVLRERAGWSIDVGDFDAAIRDLNARLHDDPNDLRAKFSRGRARFYEGDFDDAREDFEAAASDSRAGLYPVLWLQMAQARLRQNSNESLRNRLAASSSTWPAPVARMLLGEIEPSAARALAADDEGRCEADFYFAVSRLADDPSDVSAQRLRAALAECPTTFIEYEGAKALLRKLAL